MKNEIEFWQQMILTLPDDSFFDLMQIWLGKIESPFNKHDLVHRLQTLVNSPHVQQRIVALLSSQDKALISALYYAHDNSIDGIYKLFKTKISYSTFTLKLINLEQRLLLYRRHHKEQNKTIETLHINPLLYKVLKKEAININYLVLIKNQSPCASLKLWLTPLLLLSFYSYIEHNHPQIKQNGQFRKKELDELKQIFPALGHNTNGIDRREFIKLLLFQLNLIYLKKEKIYNHHENWQLFFNQEEQLVLQKIIIAALSISQEDITEVELYPQLQEKTIMKTALEKTAACLHKLFTLMPLNAQYTKENFERLLEICNLTQKKAIALELNLIGKVEKESYGITKNFINTSSKDDKSPTVLIEANYTCLIKKFEHSKELLTLASLATPTYCDIYAQFEITKYSFATILNNNVWFDTIQEELKKITNNSVPQNILYSLQNWEKSFKKIQLLQGTLLILREDQVAPLVTSGILSPYILKTITSTVYLIDETKSKQWQEALIRCGIDPLPQIITNQQKSTTSKTVSFNEDLFIKETSTQENKKIPSKKEEAKHPQEEAIIEAIKALKLPKDINQEYLARLEKKLILFPESVHAPSTTFEKREARGLDHQGKISIISHALATKKELLEIHLLSKVNGTDQILLFPTALSKGKENKRLQGITLHTQENVEIELNQIKSIRRLLSALFF